MNLLFFKPLHIKSNKLELKRVLMKVMIETIRGCSSVPESILFRYAESNCIFFLNFFDDKMKLSFPETQQSTTHNLVFCTS